MINFIEDKNLFKDKKIDFIYGITGNPVHVGHIDVVKELLTNKDAIVHVVLSKKHAFNKRLYPYKYRKLLLEMLLKRFFSNEDKRRIIIEDVELKINKKDAIYSIDIMKYYKLNYKNKKFVWAFGEDNCNEDNIKKFKDYKKLIEWDIFKIKEKTPIHSTKIRELIKESNKKELKKFYTTKELDVIEKYFK